VQNSLFVPSLGRIVDRRAAYKLSSDKKEQRTLDRLKAAMKDASLPMHEKLDKIRGVPTLERSNTIDSTLKETRFAVLPHGVTLTGWTPEQKDELDDMVRHMLHSRRSKFKRSMRGFLKYVQRRELCPLSPCLSHH
jgi:hypothetical protein